MSVLHDETRARWEQYAPEDFIRVVMKGTLRDKINVTYTVIHVYTQVMHQIPESAVACIISEPFSEVLSLRDAFLRMRFSIDDIRDISYGDTLTLPSTFTPQTFILHTVKAMRAYLGQIHQLARTIETDKQVQKLIAPGGGGKSMAQITTDILKHVADLNQILNFAQVYAEKSRPFPHSA